MTPLKLAFSIAVKELGHNSRVRSRFPFQEMVTEIFCKCAFPATRFPLDIQKSGDVRRGPISVLIMIPDPLKGTLMLSRNLVVSRVIKAKAS
jgi:hypothetical protein